MHTDSAQVIAQWVHELLLKHLWRGKSGIGVFPGIEDYSYCWICEGCVQHQEFADGSTIIASNIFRTHQTTKAAFSCASSADARLDKCLTSWGNKISDMFLPPRGIAAWRSCHDTALVLHFHKLLEALPSLRLLQLLHLHADSGSCKSKGFNLFHIVDPEVNWLDHSYWVYCNISIGVGNVLRASLLRSDFPWVVKDNSCTIIAPHLLCVQWHCVCWCRRPVCILNCGYGCTPRLYILILVLPRATHMEDRQDMGKWGCVCAG